MSTSSFNAFRAKVAADKPLQVACRKALAAGGAEIVKLGKTHDFEFTVAEAQAVVDEAELSDLELELVAGGNMNCGNSNTRS